MKTDKSVSPKTLEELTDYIKELVEKENDYNTSAEAMADAAIATFNFVSHILGATDFQTGWASMKFIKVVQGLEGPFGIIDGTKLLYPQYDLLEEVKNWIEKWKPEVAKLAVQKLMENQEDVSDVIMARWKELASLLSTQDDAIRH